MPMAMSMRGTGRMTRPMAGAGILILTEPFMKESGKRTNRMGKALSNGLMGPLIRDIMCRGRNTGRDSLFGKMEVHMKGSLLIIISMGEGFISGLMEGNTRDSGGTIKCMERVSSLGLTVEGMRGTTLTTRRRVGVHSLGLMESNILENGRMASNTDAGST